MFNQFALWTWPGAIRSGEPQRVVDRAKAARIDILIPYISQRGGTNQNVIDFPQYQDNLLALVAEAHRQRLPVHGCIDEMNHYPGMPIDLVQIRRDGSPGTVLCPANPAAREYILGELRRVLPEYDGINLEDSYIFNPNTIYDPAHQLGTQFRSIPVCFCDWCKAHAPIDQPEWTAWRQNALTELVTQMAAIVRQAGKPFSAAARMPYRRAFYPTNVTYYDGWQYCQSRDAMMADWAAWPLDFYCPMTYFNDTHIVELQTQECRQLVSADKLWMGLALGESSAEFMFGSTKQNPRYYNSAGKLAEQLELQAKLGQKQCVFFEYGNLTDEHIAVLAGCHS